MTGARALELRRSGSTIDQIAKEAGLAVSYVRTILILAEEDERLLTCTVAPEKGERLRKGLPYYNDDALARWWIARGLPPRAANKLALNNIRTVAPAIAFIRKRQREPEPGGEINMGPKTMFMAITALERLEGRANIRDGNYLYVMRYGDRDSKIGISIAPQKRLRQLRPTGVGDLVRQWFRPAGDAQEVEAVAHRVLSQWRHRISGQRERFRAGADTACLAVQLAIGLAEEERAEAARLAVDRRNIQVRSLRLAPLGLLPTHGRHIGYVLQPTAGDAGRESDMLASVGVDVAFLHVDIGKAGVGLRRACQACEAGDVLVVAEPGRLDEATMAALLAKGAVVHALLPAGM